MEDLHSANKKQAQVEDRPTQKRTRPRRLSNGLINGIFADKAEMEAYQRGLAELKGASKLEYYDDGFPKLPFCLDRRVK
jgi:hypothetical protein